MNSNKTLTSSQVDIIHKINKKEQNQFPMKIKDEIQIFDEDNNYIDYFIEIGIQPEIFKQEILYNASSLNVLDEELIPEIICKFPEFNKKKIIINNSIIDQVFPHEFKTVEAKNRPEPNFFAIMSDNQLYSVEYKYKYLSCLIIYESIDEYRKIYNKYYNKKNNENDNGFYKNIYIPKCLCIVSVFPCIDKHEEILRTLYEMTMSNKNTNLFLNQLIEELVIKTPKIPPGNKKVILKLGEKEIDLTEKKNNEYPLIHVDMTNAFGIFNISTILDIFKFILFEGNLIFFSSKISELTNSIISFLSLLSPFKYQNQIISVLSKEYYSYLESDVPFIFGINQKYTKNFFEENDIHLKNVVCIVDLDEKKCEFIPQNNIKDNPEFPKYLKDKIDTKIQEYYSSLILLTKKSLNDRITYTEENDKNSNNNIISQKNEQYQIIFYNFMVELLENYPKFLKNDINITNVSDVDINDMIDINSYLNSLYSNDRDFYRKIFNTKMFKEFILKRVDPKYNAEKIEVIFFEEKINERLAEKKMFGKARMIEQNILSLSQDYNYLPDPEIIDLSKQKIPSIVIDLFKDKYYIKDNCLVKGYDIEEDNNHNLVFRYHIFPSLFDSKFFLLNAINYTRAPDLYLQIDSINSKIVKNSFVKFNKKTNLLKNKLENDLYICYVILWSLTFWYTEEKEKEYRFKEMLLFLDKINLQKLEVYQLLFENMIKWKASENEIFCVYIKFLQQKLKSNRIIFNLIYPILQKKEMEIKDNPTAKLLKLGNELNLKTIKSKNSTEIVSFTQRTLKSLAEFERNILLDDVVFICYIKCVHCGNVIDIGKMCSNLSFMQTKNQNGIDLFKCTHKLPDGENCDYYNSIRLKFKYGVELFNTKIFQYTSCKSYNIVLLNTNTLKDRLFTIAKQYKDQEKILEIDTFKKRHYLEFWNSIWYFKLHNIDISFILPYYQENNNNNSNELNNIIITKNIENHKVNLVIDNKNIDITTSNYKSKYFFNDLFEQVIYQFSFIKEIGMVSYKNIYEYEDNINYNELPLIFENDNLEQDKEENNEDLLVKNTSLDINYINTTNTFNSKNNKDINSLFVTSTLKTTNLKNCIGSLGSEKNINQNNTLISSRSTPMLLNDVQKPKKIKGILKKYRKK